MEVEKATAKEKHLRAPKKFNAKALRLSLKFRPKIYMLILKMRMCIRQKNAIIKKLKARLEQVDNLTQKTKDSNADITTQTKDIKVKSEETKVSDENKNSMWTESGEGDAKSIADQVKEVAQNALQQNGMVYVESAGMYYDYKTGYYYNSELGLYYHNDTGCYYAYSEDQKNFVFHSYPDQSALAANAALIAHEKRKARKQKKARKPEESVDELTNSLAKDVKPRKVKRRRIMKKTDENKKTDETNNRDETNNDVTNKTEETKESVPAQGDSEKTDDSQAESKTEIKENEEVPSNGVEEELPQELEDGECSDTESEEEECDASSVSTVSDDDAISKHHPPCMRVIVRETSLPKLKVGSLYLVTKDGGTLGREGEHDVLIRDTNVSRNHLNIKYDASRRVYLATDLGSKNGTILNGQRMSESQVVSQDMEVVHGSIIQVGETKLLCHIHPGTDTCGHCEPGLIMETEEKQKQVAYTRTCSKSRQHQLELARLKNKYNPEPLMIEEKEYNDRAEQRRREVGSSHHSVKTETADIDTAIASDNKGFKLLQKMGWAAGEGLGRGGQGDTEPVPLLSNDGKAGLGTAGAVAPPAMTPQPRARNRLGPATLRLAAKTRMLQPPAKAFQEPDDEEEGEEQ